MRQPVSPITTMRRGLAAGSGSVRPKTAALRNAGGNRLLANENGKRRRFRLRGAAARGAQWNRRGQRARFHRRRDAVEHDRRAFSVARDHARDRAPFFAQQHVRVARRLGAIGVAHRPAQPVSTAASAKRDVDPPHRKSPRSACTSASPAAVAVSVRSTRGPSASASNPFACAAATSRASNPPSGPINSASGPA